MARNRRIWSPCSAKNSSGKRKKIYLADTFVCCKFITDENFTHPVLTCGKLVLQKMFCHQLTTIEPIEFFSNQEKRKIATYKCDRCPYSSLKKDEFTLHLRKVHGKPVLVRFICNKTQLKRNQGPNINTLS